MSFESDASVISINKSLRQLRDLDELAIKTNFFINDPIKLYRFSVERMEAYRKYAEFQANFTTDLLTQKPIIPAAAAILQIEGNELQFLRNLKYASSFLYDHLIVDLLTQFEIYVNNIIRLIYTKDEYSKRQLRIDLTLGEVLENIDKLNNLVIENQIFRIAAWRKKVIVLSQSPLKFDLRLSREYNTTVREAIARRNIIVHNGGIVNEQYLKETKHIKGIKLYEIGTKINSDNTYFAEVKRKIGRLVNRLDKKYKDHYASED